MPSSAVTLTVTVFSCLVSLVFPDILTIAPSASGSAFISIDVTSSGIITVYVKLFLLKYGLNSYPTTSKELKFLFALASLIASSLNSFVSTVSFVKLLELLVEAVFEHKLYLNLILK